MCRRTNVSPDAAQSEGPRVTPGVSAWWAETVGAPRPQGWPGEATGWRAAEAAGRCHGLPCHCHWARSQGGPAMPDPRGSCAGTSLSCEAAGGWRLCPGRAGWEAEGSSEAVAEGELWGPRWKRRPPSEGLAWWAGESPGDGALWRGQWQRGAQGSGPPHPTQHQPARSAGRLVAPFPPRLGLGPGGGARPPGACRRSAHGDCSLTGESPHTTPADVLLGNSQTRARAVECSVRRLGRRPRPSRLRSHVTQNPRST